MKLFAHSNEKRWELDLSDEQGQILVQSGKDSFVVNLDDQPGVIRTAFLSGGKKRRTQKIEFGWTRRESRYIIVIDGISYEIEVLDPRTERAESLYSLKPAVSGPIQVLAPIPGRVTRILVKEGSKVEKGQPVLTLDAMKLENEIQAPRAGKVSSLSVKAGNAVEKNAPLFIIR